MEDIFVGGGSGGGGEWGEDEFSWVWFVRGCLRVIVGGGWWKRSRGMLGLFFKVGLYVWLGGYGMGRL